jgi:hypothetical protein
VIGATFTLNGSQNATPNGRPPTYRWTVTGAPSGSLAMLSSQTAASTTLKPDKTGLYTISLTVSDGETTSSQDEVQILANGFPVAFPGDATYPPASEVRKSFRGLTQSTGTASIKSTISYAYTASTYTLTDTPDTGAACTYSATIGVSGLSPTTFSCTDGTSGTWVAKLGRVIYPNDYVIRLEAPGVGSRVIYGMTPSELGTITPVSVPAEAVPGSYRGIGIFGQGGEVESVDFAISIAGQAYSLFVTRQNGGTCTYSASLQTGTTSISERSFFGATYSCSDGSAGSWTILDFSLPSTVTPYFFGELFPPYYTDIVTAFSAGGQSIRLYGLR